MPPFHIIHWGNIRREYAEVPRLLKQIEKRLGRVPNTRVVLVQDPDPKSFFDAIVDSLMDRNCQVLYLTCHGDTTHLLYGQNLPTVSAGGRLSYQRLFERLHRLEVPSSAVRGVSIVFGACEAMDVTPPIELIAPEWVQEIAGFHAKPEYTHVADLAAGVLSNLGEFGNAVSDAITTATSNSRGSGFDAQWREIIRAAQAAHDGHVDQHGVDLINRNFIIAQRIRGTEEWRRLTTGTNQNSINPDQAQTPPVEAIHNPTESIWIGAIICNSCRNPHDLRCISRNGRFGLPHEMSFVCPNTHAHVDVSEDDNIGWSNRTPFPTDTAIPIDRWD